MLKLIMLNSKLRALPGLYHIQTSNVIVPEWKFGFVFFIIFLSMRVTPGWVIVIVACCTSRVRSRRKRRSLGTSPDDRSPDPKNENENPSTLSDVPGPILKTRRTTWSVRCFVKTRLQKWRYLAIAKVHEAEIKASRSWEQLCDEFEDLLRHRRL